MIPSEHVTADEVADALQWLTTKISPTQRDALVIAMFQHLATRAHICAEAKGQWAGAWRPRKGKNNVNELYVRLNEAEIELRIGNAEAAAVELAQLILKVLDLRALYQWDIGGAVLRALSHNANQPAVQHKEYTNVRTKRVSSKRKDVPQGTSARSARGDDRRRV